MAIYLDTIERNYLKQILTRYPSSWWPHKKLLEKIQQEEQRIEDQNNCPHVFGVYRGKKECCTKCQTLEVGMGEIWTLTKKQT